jgi:hypothetical protein
MNKASLQSSYLSNLQSGIESSIDKKDKNEALSTPKVIQEPSFLPMADSQSKQL